MRGHASLALVLLAACSGGTGSPSQETSAAAESATADRPQRPRIDLAVAARPATQSGEGQCKQITGYLNDPDPAGRVVRAGPSPSARELGRILPPLGDEQIAASFEILRSRDGWLEVEGAGYDETLTGKAVPAVYSGRGWIWGGGVTVGLRSTTGFAEPSHHGPAGRSWQCRQFRWQRQDPGCRLLRALGAGRDRA